MDKAKASRMTRDEAEALLSEYADTLRADPLDLSAFCKAHAAVFDAMMGGRWRSPETAPQNERILFAYVCRRAHGAERYVVCEGKRTGKWWATTTAYFSPNIPDAQVLGWLPIEMPTPPVERVKWPPRRRCEQ